jgi:hypothetical protein
MASTPSVKRPLERGGRWRGGDEGEGQWGHAHEPIWWRTPAGADGGFLPAPESTAGAIRQRHFTHTR